MDVATTLRQERSAETRRLLLDATIEALVEVGYARASTTEVAARAGVSRGAQLHHFGTKVEMVTAAVAHLGRRRTEELERLLAGERSLERFIDLWWSMYDGELFAAWLELQVAARTDPELARSLRPVTAAFADWLEERLRELGARVDALTLVAALDGLALARIAGADEKRCRAALREVKRLATAAP